MLFKTGKKAMPTTRTGINSTRQPLHGSQGLSGSLLGVILLPVAHLATPADILVITTGGWGSGASTWWAEAGDTTQHSVMHLTAPQQRINGPKMSVVPSLRNPGLALISSC